MEYIDVAWFHDDAKYPVRLVSELDSGRFETRKLEFFIDGRVTFADGENCSGCTELGVVEVPSLYVINLESEFQGKAISHDEFEALWGKYVPRCNS